MSKEDQDSKADQEPKAEQLPALCPNFAWKKLMMQLMVERGFKYKYLLATAVGVCNQTISRWFSDNPPSPSPASFKKVADYLLVSEDDLARKWLSFMNERYPATYQHPPSDTIRDSVAYGEPDLVEQAKALKRFDLGKVPLEQRPSLYHQRHEILELAAEIEELKMRSSSRLESMLTSFLHLYQSAVDTARRMTSS